VGTRRSRSTSQVSRSREADAFGDLFDRHAQAVFAFCARRTADLSLAEDLTSIVFLEAWRHRERTVLASAPDALPWLLGVANNVVRNAARSRRRHRAALERLPRPSNATNTEEEALDRADTERRMREALAAMANLSKGERDVVILVLWSGLSYDEAAKTLSLPIGTVRSRLSRARTKLQTSIPHLSPTLKESL
jgi:RNA polymerase sigma factor (sigma-70 family)